jgi:Lrp/AsnC family leucine-responsive transcriptional regulator
MYVLDSIDRRIIFELQKDARISNQELAERVELSPSPCLRRVRRLEEEGIITGYSAVIDHDKVGMPISAYVRFAISNHDAETRAEVESRLHELPHVVEAYLLAGGEEDYLIKVATESFADYETFLRTELALIPGVASARTTFAYKNIKARMPLPLA